MSSRHVALAVAVFVALSGLSAPAARAEEPSTPAVTAVLAGAWLYARAARSPVPPTLADVPPALWWGGALGTLAVIMLVTLVQSLRLGSSGEAVARMAGALPVPPETRDPLERRLLNVVEEMVNMMMAFRAYEASVATFNAAKTMMLKTLELGRV